MVQPDLKPTMDMLTDEVATLRLAFENQILAYDAELKRVKTKHRALLQRHRSLLNNEHAEDACNQHKKSPYTANEQHRGPAQETSADPDFFKSLERRLRIADATALCQA
jgi:hypothetical protein